MKLKALLFDSSIYLLGLCIVALFWFNNLVEPNSFTFAFGGDALFLYYNTTYHACFGDGVMLQNMSYPYGESIFMTDAQGALALLLSQLQKWGVNTCDYGVGIVNGFILYLLPLTLVFVVKILRWIKLPIWWAILSGVGISFLSPQILRMSAHYGLAYPFIIPMGFYWILRKMHFMRWEKRDLIYLTVSTFFFFNNPYIGFACFLFIPLTMIIKMVMDAKARNTFSYSFTTATLGIAVSILAYLKLCDPFDYRVEEQWGFFSYSANLQGLLVPPNSFANSLISTISNVADVEFETRISIGIVTILVLIIALMLWLYRFKNNKVQFKTTSISNYRPLLIASLLISIVGFNKNIFFFPERLLSDHFPTLLLFKATARFVWLLYYVVTIWASYYIFQLISNITNAKLSLYLALGAIGSIWIAEAGQMMKLQSKQQHSVTPFVDSKKYHDILIEHHIDTTNYQAILALPIKHGWASKFRQPHYWASQFFSSQISIETGLPMVDGRLSRMDVRHGMKILQLESDPLIDKSLLYDVLPNSKPILLINTHKKNPPRRDQYWIEQAELIIKLEKFSLYKLDTEKLINSKQKQVALSQFNEHGTNDSLAIAFQHFDDKGGHKTILGNGALSIQKSKSMIELTSATNPSSSIDTLEISFWMHVNNQKSGMPKFAINFNNDVKLQSIIKGEAMRNIIGDWVQVKDTIISAPKSDISILYESDENLIIDELLIRKIRDDIYYTNGSAVSVNNIIIKE